MPWQVLQRPSCVSLVHLHLRAKSLVTVVHFTVLGTWGSGEEDCWFEASLGNDMRLHLKKVRGWGSMTEYLPSRLLASTLLLVLKNKSLGYRYPSCTHCMSRCCDKMPAKQFEEFRAYLGSQFDRTILHG